MTRHGQSPATLYSILGVQRLGFLKNFITRPTIVVGDYTYYDDPAVPSTSSAGTAETT
jgi:virginiamycin A acetyltransferase